MKLLIKVHENRGNPEKKDTRQPPPKFDKNTEVFVTMMLGFLGIKGSNF